MKQSLKFFTAGILVALLLVGGYRAYNHYTALAAMAEQGSAAYSYLSSPIGKNDKGEPVTRAMIIDSLLQKGINESRQPALPVGGNSPTP